MQLSELLVQKVRVKISHKVGFGSGYLPIIVALIIVHHRETYMQHAGCCQTDFYPDTGLIQTSV